MQRTNYIIIIIVKKILPSEMILNSNNIIYCRGEKFTKQELNINYYFVLSLLCRNKTVLLK